jgi:ABC-type dipeptide/oligopeptide/nickel transport system ATPase component
MIVGWNGCGKSACALAVWRVRCDQRWKGGEEITTFSENECRDALVLRVKNAVVAQTSLTPCAGGINDLEQRNRALSIRAERDAPGVVCPGEKPRSITGHRCRAFCKKQGCLIRSADLSAHSLLLGNQFVRGRIPFARRARDLADRLAPRVAAALLVAVQTDGWERFGVCDALPCRCVYLDRSRNRSRRYCSQLCADRVAAAHYRDRVKGRTA